MIREKVKLAKEIKHIDKRIFIDYYSFVDIFKKNLEELINSLVKRLYWKKNLCHMKNV